MLAPINSVKHFVPKTNSTVASGAVSDQTIVDAVSVASVGGNTFDVKEGAVVKAVWLEYWMNGAGVTTSDSQVTAVLLKLPNGLGNPTATNLLNLQSYDNKKNVLNTFQGNIGARVDGNGGVPFMRGWYKIPKGKQRMGLGDKISMILTVVGNSIGLCGMAIYKEYN